MIRNQESACAVPTGLRNEHVESLFPTLKRGANQLCASGAFVRTLLMQSSIKPIHFIGFYGTRPGPNPWGLPRLPVCPGRALTLLAAPNELFRGRRGRAVTRRSGLEFCFPPLRIDIWNSNGWSNHH